MEIVDVIIFAAEDDYKARKYLEDKFDDSFISDIENLCAVKCTVQVYHSIKDIRTMISERFKKTQLEGKLYLSIGIIDAIDLDAEPNGKFALPKSAVSVLKKEMEPLFKQYHFRSVFCTNIFNYCEEMKKMYQGNNAYTKKFDHYKTRIKDLIENKVKSLISQKKPGIPGGEGKVDEDVIKDIKSKLVELIQDEMNYRESSNSIYIKR